MTIETMVHSALRNARDNGYHFAGASTEEIATDIKTYDADLEDESVEEIAKHVKTWQGWPQ